jgi:hypothetical protein
MYRKRGERHSPTLWGACDLPSLQFQSYALITSNSLSLSPPSASLKQQGAQHSNRRPQQPSLPSRGTHGPSCAHMSSRPTRDGASSSANQDASSATQSSSGGGAWGANGSPAAALIAGKKGGESQSLQMMVLALYVIAARIYHAF